MEHTDPSKMTGQELRTETDRLRRSVIQHQTLITQLEKEAHGRDELRDILLDLVREVGDRAGLDPISDENTSTPEAVLLVLRRIMEDISKKHEKSTLAFESQYKAAVMSLQKSTREAEHSLEMEKRRLEDAKEGLKNKERLYTMLHLQNRDLKPALSHKNDQAERHLYMINAESDAKNSVNEELVNKAACMQKQLFEIQRQQHELEQSIECTKTERESQTQILADIKQRRRDLKRRMKLVAHKLNCTTADLDKKKDELRSLTLQIESFRGNSEVQTIIGAEARLQQLESILQNEKDTTFKCEQKQETKLQSLKAAIDAKTESITYLNKQIEIATSKLQQVMNKAPDFTQIQQIIDTSIKQAKESRKKALITSAQLADMHERTRQFASMSITESKQRMKALKLQMPLSNTSEEFVPPKVAIEESAEEAKELEALFYPILHPGETIPDSLSDYL